MDPMLMIMGMTALIPLVMFGTAKLVDVYRQIFLAKQGYVKADVTRPNRRQIQVYVKPADNVNVVEGKTYPFNNHPDYLVQESGIIGTIPKISIDCKSASQVRPVNSDIGDVTPQLMTGAGKLAYTQGMNDATTDLKEIKKYVLIGVVCSLISALATFAPMLMKGGGGA